MKNHHYKATITWTGNNGSGTTGYRDYERNHTVQITGKPVIEASSDPSFLGDPTRHNPEDLFLASLSQCHMLWFLHLCSVNGVVVTQYSDEASGTMQESPDGSGRFTEVVLQPTVVVAEERMADKVDSIHEQAHSMCFIANSCNFPVKHKATVRFELSTQKKENE